MKELILKIVILMLPSGIFSQDLSGLREISVVAGSDTIIIDSLRIVPGTIELKSYEGKVIDNELYQTDPLNSLLIINDGFTRYNEEIRIKYRVFTSDPDLSITGKDTSLIIPFHREADIADPYRYTYRSPDDDIWKEQTLERSGSISRGIDFGNNHDVIVNSNLNLQLSGKLDENLSITASISDQNIPLQPEGYSRQIHEFDKIFIQLYNDDLSITAGDFDVKGGGGMFLPLEKKGQGAQFGATLDPGPGPFNSVSNTASAAVSKGRYHRNSFTGIEGNQGPYKLRGANNEPFIIVLAGTERVFVDGRILTRGMDRDYTIDYNLAEITFTSNMPVTKDRRIIVEFEYSDRNYARFMLSNTTAMSTERGNYFLNIFSEHDARNLPLMQELGDEEKELLSNIGDSLHQAWVPKIDSVEFRNDVVLYEKADTLVNEETYTIYRHSVDPEKAYYRLGFSYVGENRGNYTLKKSSANGRVFSWVAPVNGIPSGSHEPVILLVTPKKQQVVNMGGSNFISENTETSFEIAISNSDKNTFSDLDYEDNTGLAFRVGLDNSTPLGTDDHWLGGGMDFEYSARQFTTAERFRPVEYERDWNLQDITEKADEQKLSWYADYNRRTVDFASYKGEYLNLSGNYSGIRNMLEAGTGKYGFDTRLMISYLSSGSEAFSTGFFRHKAEISRPLWLIILGVRREGENNRIKEKTGGSLSSTSLSFHQREIFLENSDTAKFHFFTAYRERADKLPLEEKLEHSSFAREFSAGFRSDLSQGNQLSGTIHHRRLETDDTFPVESDMPGNSLNGRLEKRLRLFEGIIQSSGFYETGSGLEVKRDFMYIEVAQGQGTHTWTDYNENGIKELDEFEPAVFPDQASYIRVFIPGDDFISIRSNQFNQNIRINPPPDWQNRGGLRRFLSFFSNHTAFQSGQKTSRPDLAGAINPFYSKVADTNLINLSSSLRNTISLQTPGRRFFTEYLHQNNKSKNLLVNGFDLRETRSNALHSRFEASPAVTLNSLMETGTKFYRSGFFPGRDFNIDHISGRAGVSFQPGYSLQTSVNLKWTRKENHPGNEKAELHNLDTEVSYSIPSQGDIVVRAGYYYITFNAGHNTPLAWEMLEGLKPGNNMTLTVQFRQNLTGDLQMSLNYNGRKAQGKGFIHTGGMQMRAYF